MIEHQSPTSLVQPKMLDWALSYLDDEWSVLPVCTPVPNTGRCQQHGDCKHPGKIPLIKWARYQDQLPTCQEVTDWWTRWPTANIGCATGETSGFVVVDLDGELAIHTAAERGYDEDAPSAFTGRVGGRHLYFRYRPDAPTLFAKSGGIDFRGHGGYVCLPPSLHASGRRYKWDRAPGAGMLPALPDWVIELGARPTETDHAPLDLPARLRDGIPTGERNETLFKTAAKLRGQDFAIDAAYVILRQMADACVPPVAHAEADEFVTRVYRTYAPNPAPSAPLFSGGRVVNPDTGEILEESANDYAWQSFAELVNQGQEERGQLVTGMLWQGRVHWVFGAPGTGKTLFCTALGMHVAAGESFNGRAVKQGGVLCIEEDSPLSVMADYVDDLADIYEFKLEKLPIWITKEPGLRIMDEASLARAKRAVEAAPGPISLLILDSSEKLTPSDRYTSREYDPLLRFLQWCLARGITVIIIDHTRKQQTLAASAVAPDPIDLLYGGRAKSAMADVMTYFSGTIGKGARITYPKFRGRAPLGHDVLFDSSEGFKVVDLLRTPSDTEREVIRVLNEAHRVGDGWVTKDALAAALSKSEKTIQRLTGLLVTDGLIQRDEAKTDGGRGNAARFRVAGEVRWNA